MIDVPREIRVTQIDDSIHLLKTYLTDTDIGQVIDALEALKADPFDEEKLGKLHDSYSQLPGISQGAVLTHAEFLRVVLEDDRFGEDPFAGLDD